MLPDSAAPICKKVTSPSWLFGYDPTMKVVGPTPNGLAQWRILANGEVRLVLVEARMFIPALRSVLSQDKLSLDEALDHLRKLDVTIAKKLCSQGCVFHTFVQKSISACFIPTGWLVAEMSVRGVLLYGVRKAVVTESLDAHSNYEELIGVFKASGKATENMEEMLSHLEPDSEV